MNGPPASTAWPREAPALIVPILLKVNPSPACHQVISTCPLSLGFPIPKCWPQQVGVGSARREEGGTGTLGPARCERPVPLAWDPWAPGKDFPRAVHVASTTPARAQELGEE